MIQQDISGAPAGRGGCWLCRPTPTEGRGLVTRMRDSDPAHRTVTEPASVPVYLRPRNWRADG